MKYFLIGINGAQEELFFRFSLPFIHIERILELYNRDTEFDNLAFQYSEKRNYLIEGFG